MMPLEIMMRMTSLSPPPATTEFAICWPSTCPHAPAVTTDAPKKVRKLIVKVLA